MGIFRPPNFAALRGQAAGYEADLDSYEAALRSWQQYAAKLRTALAQAKQTNEDLALRRDAFRETAYEIAEAARIPEERVQELARKNYEELRSEAEGK